MICCAYQQSLLVSLYALNLTLYTELRASIVSLQSEFADALALQPDSLFVDSMFSIIDKDANGYISFRELLYTVLLFAKGAIHADYRLGFD